MYVELIVKPWGHEKILAKNEFYVLKELTVSAGAQISLQKHIRKTESWYVVAGRGMVTLCTEENQFPVGMGNVVDIDRGVIHRIQAGDEGIIIIEASTPELDDVVRIKDDYGRAD